MGESQLHSCQTAGYNAGARSGWVIAPVVYTPSPTQSDVRRNSPQELPTAIVASTKGSKDAEGRLRQIGVITAFRRSLADRVTQDALTNLIATAAGEAIGQNNKRFRDSPQVLQQGR